jgi:aryl-alcohol dehydrogenase-like predicted oxidoreductase
VDKRKLGKTGLMVSPIGLGTVKFGRNQGIKYPVGFDIPAEGDLADLLALARDLGINLIDTAPAYGLSEERLGRLLKGQRGQWVIAGKAGEEFDRGRSSYDFSPAHVEASLERSLKRLATDYLDLLLIHCDGTEMDILSNEPLLSVLQDFRRRGMVRAIGASTRTVEGGIRALELLDVAMVTYSPLYTDEGPVLDYGLENGKGVLVKKALSSGHVGNIGGTDPVQKSMDFVCSHRGATSVIVGTIDPGHLRHNVAAVRRALNNGNLCG